MPYIDVKYTNWNQLRTSGVIYRFIATVLLRMAKDWPHSSGNWVCLKSEVLNWFQLVCSGSSKSWALFEMHSPQENRCDINKQGSTRAKVKRKHYCLFGKLSNQLIGTRRQRVSSTLLTTKKLIMDSMKNKQDKRKRKQTHEYLVDKERETQSTRQTVHRTGINTSIQKVVVIC